MKNDYKKNSLNNVTLFDIINIGIILVLTVIFLYPLLFVLFASFSDIRLLYDNPLIFWPKGFNIESYKEVINNANIWIGYKNTIVYTFVGTVLNVIMTSIAAYPLSRKDFYGRHILTFFFAFTMYFSGGMIPTYLVVQKVGLINSMWALVIPGVISVYNLIIMRTYFQNNIPMEVQESAFIDGCSNFKMLYKIILPLSTPVITVMVLFYGVAHWNAYFNALIYISDRNKFPLQLILREILVNNQMDSMLDIAVDGEGYGKQIMIAEGLKYAVIVVSSLPVLIIFPFIQNFFKEGIMIGSIKG